MAETKRFRIGEFLITPVSDGGGSFNMDNFRGISEADRDAILYRAFGRPGPYEAFVNAFVIDTGRDVYLVDNGAGDKFGPDLGKLKENMQAAGYAFSQVSALINTHLHIDHVGGCFADGKALFENAEFIACKTEYEFWTDPNIRERAPNVRQASIDLANNALAAYADRLRIIGDDEAAFPGITAVPLFGHTPGHSGYLIESGGESLLIWGDIIHFAAVQLARPDVTILFDIDPPQAAATREALLEKLASDRTLIAGMHTPFPGIGAIERAEEGYRFVPAV